MLFHRCLTSVNLMNTRNGRTSPKTSVSRVKIIRIKEELLIFTDQRNLFTRKISIERETTERRRNGNKQRNFYLPKTGGGFPMKHQSHCLRLGSHFATERGRGGGGGG